MQTYRHRHMSECFGIMSIPPSASIVSWDVINFSRCSLKIRGGGVQPPPNLSTASSGVGGGEVAIPPPPTLLLWHPWHMRIYQFIHLLYLFMYLFIHLFIYSFILNGISIYFCTDPLCMYMYITTLNRNDMCI